MMKFRDALIFVIVSISACRSHSSLPDASIINDSFLSVIDTAAYHQSTLLPPPPEAKEGLKRNSIAAEKVILVDTTLSAPDRYYHDALHFISGHRQYRLYSPLFVGHIDSSHLEVSVLTKT